MIRAILAVVIALALLSVSMPAIEEARTERTEQQLATEIDHVDRTAADLHDEEIPRTDTPGARRTVTIHIPERSYGAAGVTAVRIGAEPPNEYSYQLRGGPLHSVTASVPVRPAGGDPITIAEAGRHRLVLTLEEVDGTKTVIISPEEPQSTE